MTVNLLPYPEIQRQVELDENNAALIPLIRRIRRVFEDHFDRTWFGIIIDGLPIDTRTVRMIRELVSLESIHLGDEWFIYQAMLELNRFVLLVRKFLLPVLKERLGVSGLVPHRHELQVQGARILRPNPEGGAHVNSGNNIGN